MSENAEEKGVGVGRYIGRGGGDDVVSEHRVVKQKGEIPSREYGIWTMKRVKLTK